MMTKTLASLILFSILLSVIPANANVAFGRAELLRRSKSEHALRNSKEGSEVQGVGFTILRNVQLPRETTRPFNDADVDRAIWVANSIYNITKNKKYDDLVLMSYVLNKVKRTPAISESELITSVRQAKSLLDTKINSADKTLKSPAQLMDQAYAILKDSNVVESSLLINDALDWGPQNFAPSGLDKYQLLPALRPFDVTSVSNEYAQRLLDSVANSQDSNPVIANVVNKVLAVDFNQVTTGMPAREILARNKDLAELGTAVSVVNSTASDARRTADFLSQLFNDQNNLLNQGNRVTTQFIQNNIDRYLRDGNPIPSEVGKINEHLSSFNKVLDGADAGVFLLSSLAKATGNSKLARDITVTGGAVIKVADTINKFSELVTTGKFSSLATSLGGAAMTGNMIGAALSLVSLFSSSGPSPDEMMLKSINMVQQQIAELGKVMQARFNEIDSRFDRMDKALNQIYSDMMDNFNKINTRLDRIEGSLDTIQRNLVSLQMRLETQIKELEATILAKLDALINVVTTPDKILCYNYKELVPGRTPDPSSRRMSPDAYVRCVTNALAASETSLKIEHPEWKFTDDKISDSLQSADPLNNLNYLLKLVHTNPAIKDVGRITITADKVSDPVDWALSSEMYLKLARDWPNHYKNADLLAVNNLIKYGEAIDQTVRSLTLIKESGKTGKNDKFWGALLANYKQKVRNLNATVSNIIQRRDNNFQEQGAYNVFNLASFFSISRGEPALRIPNGPMPRPTTPPRFLSPIPKLVWASGLYFYGEVSDELVDSPDEPGKKVQKIFLELKFRYDNKSDLPSVLRQWEVIGGDHHLSLDTKEMQESMRGVAEDRLREIDRVILRRSIVLPKSIDSLYIRNNWDRGDKLAEKLMDDNLAKEEECLPCYAAIEDLGILQRRKKVIASVMADIKTSGSIQMSLNELMGARALIEMFLKLGMPQSYAREDYLRSLVGRKSNEGLFVDKNDLLEFFNQLNNKYTNPSNPESVITLDDRKDLDISPQLLMKTDELEKAINTILDKVERGELEESQPIITNTLRRLKLLRDLRP